MKTILLVLSIILSAGTAHASTIFLSTTSTAPKVGVNPSVTTFIGGTVTLYLVWEPSTNDADSGYYESVTGISHNIVDTGSLQMSTTSYAVLNPGAGSNARWSTTSLGTNGGSFLVNGASFLRDGGSNLGDSFGTAEAHTASPDRWILSTLTFHVTGNLGTSNIFLQVGSLGVAFTNSPVTRPINFGFGDASVASDSVGTASTLADALITVPNPEPDSLALLGLGAVGLVAVARRRRRVEHRRSRFHRA